MQFAIEPTTGDGVVSGVPIAAFTDWKTGTADVLALAKAGTFCRRGVMQQGFSAGPKSTNTDEDNEDVESTAKGRGSGYNPKFHGFMASCHLSLHRASLTGTTILATETAGARVMWSAVGTSSYSVASVLEFQPTAAEGATAQLGTNQITIVRIDPATRKPTPLDPEVKSRVQQFVNGERLQAMGIGKMERLTFPTLAAPPQPRWSESFTTRHSDNDFNGHLNQLMYITFAVDTTRGYLLAKTGVAADPSADTDIAELRIDYLCEVRDVGTTLTCQLFVPQDSDPAATTLWFTISANETLSSPLVAQSPLSSPAPSSPKPKVNAMGHLRLQRKASENLMAAAAADVSAE